MNILIIMSEENSVTNFLELEIGQHIVFKKEAEDNEECAKIKTKEDDGYGVKQYFNNMVVTGVVEFNWITRVPEISEVASIPGSQAHDLARKRGGGRRGRSVTGLQSNLMKDRKNNNTPNTGGLRGLV